MTAAQQGDGTAFDELVRQHSRTMFRVAFRVLGDAGEAEDAVQDAWVAAWRSLRSFRGDSAASTWLYRVVSNAALALARRRRPTVLVDPTDETLGWLTAGRDCDTPEGQAVRREEAVLVQRAIATLEPSQRVPLVLRELEGLSYEEIADVLDVTVPALQSRLHRARVALLTRLTEMRDE
jgi:RNA polymerase sigma-70 factor (ECF subfamily)